MLRDFGTSTEEKKIFLDVLLVIYLIFHSSQSVYTWTVQQRLWAFDFSAQCGSSISLPGCANSSPSCFSNMCPGGLLFTPPNFHACLPVPRCESIDWMHTYYSSLSVKFSNSHAPGFLVLYPQVILKMLSLLIYVTNEIRLLNLSNITEESQAIFSRRTGDAFGSVTALTLPLTVWCLAAGLAFSNWTLFLNT